MASAIIFVLFFGLFFHGSHGATLIYKVVDNLTEHLQSYLFTTELTTNCHTACKTRQTQNNLCIGYGYNTTNVIKYNNPCVLLTHTASFNDTNVNADYYNGK